MLEEEYELLSDFDYIIQREFSGYSEEYEHYIDIFDVRQYGQKIKMINFI